MSSFLIIVHALFIYTFFLLVFNTERGFDITDESFYILCSSNPGEVLTSTTQFGYYTGILFRLANGNLAVFRLLGLILLLATAGLFSHSLERYWIHLKGASVFNHSRWLSLSVILAGAVAYYGYWPLTPSYNWLELISVPIVATGLLHAAVIADNGETELKNNRGLLEYGFLVGIGGGLSFMAKPTSTAVLAIVSLYFITVTPLRFRWKFFVAISAISSALFVLIHAIIFENGLTPFYQKCRDGLELGKILWEGHTTSAVFLQAFEDFKQIPSRLVQIFPLPYIRLAFLFLFLISLYTRYRKNQNKKTWDFFIILLILLNTAAWIRLSTAGYWAGGHAGGTRIGFGGLALSIILILSGLFTLLIWKIEKPDDSLYDRINFRRLLSLYIFLLLLAIAYAFGSANGLILQMSGAFVFLSAASLYSAFWIDQYIGKMYLGHVISLLLVLSVCLILTLANKYPYRLPAEMKAQVVQVSFLENKGSIFVDKKTANYINDLKRTALDAGWKPGMYLIDLTGGSPGATVILGGRAPGSPWLLGKYKGSNDFAHAALAKVSTSTLRTAWILTSNKGRRKLSGRILSDLGLEFPNAYESIGKVRTGHRNEDQVLWRPVNIYSFLSLTNFEESKGKNCQFQFHHNLSNISTYCIFSHLAQLPQFNLL